jgi:serine/threonine protein kinase
MDCVRIARMPLSVGGKLGPYVILASIGAGSMREVHKARDPRLGRLVALKILPIAFANNAERRARAETEARAASALNHPGIISQQQVERVSTFRLARL